MAKKWVAWINLIAAAIGILLILAAVWLVIIRPSNYPDKDLPLRKTEVPKSSFAHPKKDYDAVGAPALTLRFAPLSLQLPDLRKYLVYYGKNGRPDAKNEKELLHFAFTGNKIPSSLIPGQRAYILFDKKQTPNQYIFSPENKETFMWIEPGIVNNQAQVKVGMKDEIGRMISEPAAYALFTLPEKEFVRFGGTTWELGKWRVDGTLLARQRARWYGIDKFIEKHGGKEYQNYENKQRIDFGEGDDAYSVYVGLNDSMIWKNDHWNVVTPDESTTAYPLMSVKKIDERLMNLELWDVEGKGKIVLNLLKSNENWTPQNIQQNFKYVGARTRSQFVFEINKERVLLSPHDWLLLTDNGWKKLVTPKEIDNYVDRKETGPLFIFDGIDRKDDQQIIVGTLFNSSRTDVAPVEIPTQGPGTNPTHDEKNKKGKENNIAPIVKTQDNQEFEKRE